MEKIYYDYKECIKDIKLLLPQIKEYNPDVIVPIARGGMTLGHLLSQALDIREVYSINSVHYDKDIKLDTIDISNIPDLSDYKRILIVDDIIDSGDTVSEVKKILQNSYKDCDIKTMTIFYKPDASVQPEFKVKVADGWIDFFWEVDLLPQK